MILNLAVGLPNTFNSSVGGLAQDHSGYKVSQAERYNITEYKLKAVAVF